MGYDSVWQWRFEQYSDEDLRQWIRRVTPGDESEIDLMAIEELAGRVVAKRGEACSLSPPSFPQ